MNRIKKIMIMGKDLKDLNRKDFETICNQAKVEIINIEHFGNLIVADIKVKTEVGFYLLAGSIERVMNVEVYKVIKVEGI